MRYLKFAALVGSLALLFGAAAGTASAQVRVGVGIGIGAPVAPVPPPAYVGAEPVCTYGYYPYYPYTCAPSGYWAPNYFVDGIFIGAGPWFHGWGWHPGPGYYHGFAPGYRGPALRSPAFHGPVLRTPAPAFRGEAGGGFHGGGSFRGGHR